jgi:hypothetical protein
MTGTPYVPATKFGAANFNPLHFEQELKGDKTILEMAELLFGHKLLIRNKTVANRVMNTRCTWFEQDLRGDKPRYEFGSSETTKVDGAVFGYGVSSRYVKKTDSYTLISWH